ncbi:3-oxoadipate enol-lactone hydrolase/4-carboxymuconolactone decarboxylase [Rhodococcus sp. RD6.2]|uniref:bifunctional 3-oxoadipate enol-lactonase/4-carboxymuconolactone decarboxylase PcaDC n=1 Tax=Rhodococcus sp. RD6.2 TaxID=260936 RepID=UPI00063B44FB|nr:3-oxoadipate enol-lactonase [Rhodococcus sp. RD6.2]CRK49275.1 3-oxoadipate enol-lactone hydrolase/4-carboxymuconolactone decarboxylase [Rhodococcus sp. RD6.2]
MTVNLAHHLIGPGPGAPTVVLLGSLGSDRSMWDPQVRTLSEQFNVLAVDLRGHGGSPVPPGPYTVAELGGDVLTLLDTLALPAAHVVGLSLGGAVAQWLATHSPARVQTLTLLCTSAKFGEPTGWFDRAAAVRSGGTGSIAEAVVERWYTSELASRDPELVASSRAMVAATSNEGYAACCEALSEWDGRADLARIAAPTLVIAGRQDPSTTPADLGFIAEGIARSALHVLDPAAHLANVEQAGRVTALIAAHVTGRAQRSEAYEAGMLVRRAVLGDAHVARSVAETTEFTAPFQDFITRTAWGDVWSRTGLDHHTRRLLTLAILTAVGNEHELDMHIRAALRDDVTPDELVEVFLHTAIYAGVPNSNRAFALGKNALAEHARSAGTAPGADTLGAPAEIEEQSGP